MVSGTKNDSNRRFGSKTRWNCVTYWPYINEHQYNLKWSQWLWCGKDKLRILGRWFWQFKDQVKKYFENSTIPVIFEIPLLYIPNWGTIVRAHIHKDGDTTRQFIFRQPVLEFPIQLSVFVLWQGIHLSPWSGVSVVLSFVDLQVLIKYRRWLDNMPINDIS